MDRAKARVRAMDRARVRAIVGTSGKKPNQTEIHVGRTQF